MKQVKFLIALIFIGGSVFGQSQLMLYQLNSRLPQSNLINPGLFPDYKVSVGLPVLSSTYVSANGGKLSFNNAFTRTADDSLHFDPNKLYSKLDENNRLEINGNTQLFYLGIKAKKNHFSLAWNERIEGGMVYPRTFIQLLASGNGAADSRVLAFDNLGLRAQAYHELSLGYGRDVTEKLSVGVRLKYLSGVVSVDVDNISAGLITSEDSLYLYSSAFSFNTAGLDILNTDDIFRSATAFKNSGFAIDLGAHYWITDKFRVSASVTDLGSINWDNDTKQYLFDEVKYSFKGADFLTLIDQNSGEDPFTEATDSLDNLYSPDSVIGGSYQTSLTSKFYAGASYHLGKHHTFGAMFYGDVFKSTVNPAFGLSYNLELGHIWTIGINASYRNNSFKNVGIGTTLTLGPVQLYAMTENIMAFEQLEDASFVDARVGLNLVFGKIKKDKKIKKADLLEPPVEDLAEVAILTEPVTEALMGTTVQEMAAGFYVIIASFETDDEASAYNRQLIDEGYAVLSGFQSELNKYYTYLMYFPDDGNMAIQKKNDLGGSFAPGRDKPWVLQVKAE